MSDRTWSARLAPTPATAWAHLSTKLPDDEATAFRDLCATHGETINRRLRRLILADLDASTHGSPTHGSPTHGGSATTEDPQ